jgi:hypothetical protein
MIDAQLLDRVLDQVTLHAGPKVLDLELSVLLREAFADIHITVCSDDDIPPRLAAVAGNAVCQLYFVDGSEHCLKLTTDADSASGIVVAMRGDED